MEDKCINEQVTASRKTLLFKDGKIYFSRDTERKILFAMTIIMLILFILSELGWL